MIEIPKNESATVPPLPSSRDAVSAEILLAAQKSEKHISSVLSTRVAGLDMEKRRVKEFLTQSLASWGIRDETGMLLEGPPGTGKSHVAKALAGELDRTYLDISLAEIRDSLAGESEKNVKRLFEQAKEHQPCLIIIDEVDALIQQRGSDDLSAGMRQLVSRCLMLEPYIDYA